MFDASSSQKKDEQYYPTKQEMMETRDSRRRLQTPEYQAQVQKAESNLQLVNMILMSFSAEQNACVEQRLSLGRHQHRTEEALRTIIYEMKQK
ncbi:hypothetical protein CGGC5_v005947 [Colletotrichum fructicola Nara gc5]|uniref:Uncharacterized protein n=1 Tax=Colletotrichum fructicola (strain Nara gc5) TaxID=1213859 RepID=A0A7J6JCW1_COLFN|nr:hypothetical protein CGGC5_v005947 [Colletotrichum fructicola Nara gc5]KAF4881169.1 hypothetical protein CGCFRS4_v015824 [Colletotrichum fructicola]